MTSTAKLFVSDVDGTLLTPDKTLTDRAIRAVRRLGDEGIRFAITSARPPEGLAMFVEPLALSTPLGALNGAVVVDRDMRVLEQKVIHNNVSAPIIDLLHAHDLSVWVYQGAHWFVLDTEGPYVQRESLSIKLQPVQLASFDQLVGGVAKIVGVGDDERANAAASSDLLAKFNAEVSATQSQNYYLDVTHLDANKGSVIRYLSKLYDVAPSDIVTIGDMHNDVSMFNESGLSIAMGNADESVQRAAHEVTRSNSDEGFARAVETFVLDA